MSAATRHSRAPAAILRIFMVHYPRALKKYDLEKQSGLARETVRSWLPSMENWGWVQAQPAGKSNAGKNMINYSLTELGWFQGSCLNPNLRGRAKRLLGSRYRQFEDTRTIAPRRRMKDYLEAWLPTITRAMETGTAQPGFYYCLELTTDKNGKIHLGKRSKVGILPTP
ncbi:MAG TPA: hypothetical protein VEI80_01220 [Candidatus Acidoferrales bacterium]|nr:hypothetical protein [Candidatus Acidoferrales bacterium]